MQYDEEATVMVQLNEVYDPMIDSSKYFALDRELFNSIRNLTSKFPPVCFSIPGSLILLSIFLIFNKIFIYFVLPKAKSSCR